MSNPLFARMLNMKYGAGLVVVSACKTSQCSTAERGRGRFAFLSSGSASCFSKVKPVHLRRAGPLAGVPHGRLACAFERRDYRSSTRGAMVRKSHVDGGPVKREPALT